MNNTVQEPFRLMDLPPELRNMIYRLAVVRKTGKCYTLVPPALAQVSKDIRTEVLPIFYGENSFYIHMDIDVIEYEEGIFPIRTDDDSKLEEFLDMCSCLAATGGLKFIKVLSMNYSEPVFEDMSNFLLGFKFIGESSTRQKYRDRIGDDNLDWSNRLAVVKAFETTLKESAGEFLGQLKAHVPVSDVIRALFAVAKHCHCANKYVELSWDYGH
ncbi:hypothetical protein UA08_05669 [Talaromyces atroroseus]|uniref:F-box domain-containing protein n=1 Tax=Talaromyces atroroseus TaxID=1441469 RepID=A0A225AUF6_TALAT|nr:hypothetical protein UA08_05669 [Talaromyces atroroseus]OKL59229.1 hypothetical protein UA08_05669 [Talaromyces atroroseus]